MQSMPAACLGQGLDCNPDLQTLAGMLQSSHMAATHPGQSAARPLLAVHSVPVHGGRHAVTIGMLGGVGSLGSFVGAGREQVVLQLEGLAKAPICLQPLVLHRHQLLQQPLQGCLHKAVYMLGQPTLSNNTC